MLKHNTLAGRVRYSRRTGMATRTKLIWHAGDGHYFDPLLQAFRYFRREFLLTEEECADQPQYLLSLFASSRYLLYVNGEYVTRGPARSDYRWSTFDQIDVTRHIRKGRNVIAVLCLYYGYGTGQTMNSARGLAGQLVSSAGQVSKLLLVTDEAWRSFPAEAYDPQAPRVNSRQGPVEIFDARNEPMGWNGMDFDDSHWPNASVMKHDLANSVYWNLSPSGISLLEEKIVHASEVVAQGSSGTEAASTAQTKTLHRYVIQTLASADIQPVDGPRSQVEQILSFQPGKRSNVGQARIVVYRFEKLCAGYLVLQLSGAAGTVVDCIYSEELTEHYRPVVTSDNRPIDRFVLREGDNEFEVAFGWKACRYLTLVIHSDDDGVIIQQVGLRSREYPFTEAGRFETTDVGINRIFSICQHTARICAQDAFVDSPGREQQQWIGDGRWTALTYYHLTGSTELYRKMLRQLGQSQDFTGMIRPRHPDDHNNIPPIPAFSLSWISAFYEFFLHTGDLDLVQEWWPNVGAALHWFSNWENTDGLLEDVPQWMFIDWGYGTRMPDVRRGGIVTALNLQYLEALLLYAALAEYAGHMKTAEVATCKAGELRQAISARCWNPAKGAYADSVVGGLMSESVSEATNVLALMYLEKNGPYPLTPRVNGVAATAIRRTPVIMKNVIDRCWNPGQTDPMDPGTPVPGSPFYTLRLLQALALHDRHELALELLRNRYGIFIDADSSTTWEKWQLFRSGPDGSLIIDSASHGWGASAILFLVKDILGIKPLQPGFREFSFTPRPCGLDRIEGSVSTPFGPISVLVDKHGATLQKPEQLLCIR